MGDSRLYAVTAWIWVRNAGVLLAGTASFVVAVVGAHLWLAKHLAFLPGGALLGAAWTLGFGWFLLTDPRIARTIGRIFADWELVRGVHYARHSERVLAEMVAEAKVSRDAQKK